MLVVLPRTEVKPQGFPSPADVSALHFSPAHRTPEWLKDGEKGQALGLPAHLPAAPRLLDAARRGGEVGSGELRSASQKPTQISPSPGDSPCPRQSQQG